MTTWIKRQMERVRLATSPFPDLTDAFREAAPDAPPATVSTSAVQTDSTPSPTPPTAPSAAKPDSAPPTVVALDVLPPDVQHAKEDAETGAWRRLPIGDLLTAEEAAAVTAADGGTATLAVTKTWAWGWDELHPEDRADTVRAMLAVTAQMAPENQALPPADGGEVFAVGGAADVELSFVAHPEAGVLWLTVAS